MIKLIKRISDNKYLNSIEKDIWSDDIKDAYEMTYKECEDIKSLLLKNYLLEDIKEIVNNSKNKQITREEVKELKNLFKK